MLSLTSQCWCHSFVLARRQKHCCSEATVTLTQTHNIWCFFSFAYPGAAAAAAPRSKGVDSHDVTAIWSRVTRVCSGICWMIQSRSYFLSQKHPLSFCLTLTYFTNGVINSNAKFHFPSFRKYFSEVQVSFSASACIFFFLIIICIIFLPHKLTSLANSAVTSVMDHATTQVHRFQSGPTQRCHAPLAQKREQEAAGRRYHQAPVLGN